MTIYCPSPDGPHPPPTDLVLRGRRNKRAYLVDDALVLRGGQVTTRVPLSSIDHLEVVDGYLRLELTDGTARSFRYGHAPEAHIFAQAVAAAVDPASGPTPGTTTDVTEVTSPRRRITRQGWWTIAAVGVYMLVMVTAIAAARDGRGGTAFVTVLVITFGCFMWWEAGKALGVTAAAWRSRGITVVGQVVRYEEGSDGSGNFPVIEYTTVDGGVYRQRSDVARWRRTESGDVQVTYDPKRPQRIREELTPWRVFVGCLLLAIGFLLLGMAVQGVRLAF